MGLGDRQGWPSASATESRDRHLFFDVRPVKVDPTSNATTQANQADNAKYAVSLSPDDIVTFKVRVGAAITDVTVGIGNSISVTKGTDSQGNTLTISGSAVPVAIAEFTGMVVVGTLSTGCLNTLGAESAEPELFVAVITTVY